ncbi:MAG: hypothetical protein CME63_16090 [Halobacteriovoraceae bacterium]|nr:hypothetical protein [Halobacteriovoraceae bacterium]|tara:strand:+ start:89628 stop:90848 length:1221 start_codon:yes stop_codon:yes gene_type:complete
MRLASIIVPLLLFYFVNTEASEDSQLKPTWGVAIPHNMNPHLELKVGARLQSVAEWNRLSDEGRGELNQFDFYLRRVRFEFESYFKKDWHYYMDIRNDNADLEEKGSGQFEIGDAYLEKKNIFGLKGISFRGFRSKVKLSRSQTISSAKLLHLERAYISDSAADFVNEGRRATNFQMNGVLDYFSFQLVAGDGVHKSSFVDAKDNDLGSGEIIRQSPMLGAYMRLYPFEGWSDQSMTETYFGQGQHFSLGGGLFHTGSIEYTGTNFNNTKSIDRTLGNIELSFHYKNFSFQGEFFHFEGVVEDFSASVQNKGSSNGLYWQAEYYLSEENPFSLFGRYESWDRFKEESDYDQKSYLMGINWYYDRNHIRFSLAWQQDRFDQNLRKELANGEDYNREERLKFTTMWNF